MESIEHKRQRALVILQLLKKATKHMTPPMSALITAKYGKNPFLILISCLLSLRTRDPVTFKVSEELFKYVRTPQELVKLPVQKVEKILHPLGFFHRKAKTIHDVSKTLIVKFHGLVPANEEELLSLKGVGRKTANLVLGEAFGIPALCVDTHVHRVANRLGLVETQNPNETERELQKIIPRHEWIALNHLFVMWGQNICVPVSPFCSRCILNPLCPKRGVVKSR